MTEVNDQYQAPPHLNKQYKEKVDIQFIFNNQVERCLRNLGSGYFPENVEALLRIIPGGSYDKILLKHEEWNPNVTDFEYEYAGPIRLGSEKEPLTYPINNYSDDLKPVPYTKNEDEEKVIDWEHPDIRSPRLVTKEVPDYMMLFKIILQEAEDTGLSWKTEAINAEYGLYPEKEEIDKIIPTPLDDPKKNDVPRQNPLYHICWIKHKGIPKRVTNFRGYALGINEGEKPWFFTEIAHRQKKQKPIVLMITATQGEGKTYCGIRLAEIFDKKFDPDKQIVMDRTNILKLVSGRGGLKRNQVILIDESQWGASAREWGKKEQIKLMKFLAAARFKGYIIIIVALHRSMLDSIIRERIINFHIHMEERGHATVYQPKHARFDESRYPARVGKLLVQMPDYDVCEYPTCLTCPENETCMTIRARYERNKTHFVESEADKDSKTEMAEAAAEMSERDLAEMLIDDIQEIRVNRNGFYDTSDVKYVLLDKYGADISGKKSERVRIHLMKLKPPPPKPLV